jgi:hypothetical protein
MVGTDVDVVLASPQGVKTPGYSNLVYI